MPCRSIPQLYAIYVAALGAILYLASPPAAGQSGPASSENREVTAAGFPLVRAVRVEGAPETDDDVLGDPMWDDAVPTTGFRQSTPNEAQPASERTEVRIVYNGETLYVGVICYVRDPSTIIVFDSRRDTPLNETDSFRIIIDTYLDRQNGFVFGTNPAGAATGFSCARRPRCASGRRSTPRFLGPATTSICRPVRSWPTSDGFV